MAKCLLQRPDHCPTMPTAHYLAREEGMHYYARSRNAAGEMQLLRDHLLRVGARAGELAEACGLPRELGEWAGWLHDLGKYSEEFQEVRMVRGDNRPFIQHACHGAWVAWEAHAYEVALSVAAHHATCPTPETLRNLVRGPEDCFKEVGTVRERAARFAALAEAEGVFSGNPPATPRDTDRLALDLRTRLLLSCLADADRLDAEAWAYPYRGEVRAKTPLLEPLIRLAALDVELDRIRETNRGAPHVREARDQVMAAARAAGTIDQGFFSLTVPTGGGKTLASLAFALEHARAHGLRRILFVLPFLAIIEQNVDVIRSAVGDRDGSQGLVLEHHSNVASEEDDDGQDIAAVRRRLLAENWDAPVIVTTAVQFFESLFAAHPTRLRKIHNIPGSVVVFDEAQTFPPGLLTPLVGMLRQLADGYRCSFLFCTATQPALDLEVGAGTSRDVLLPAGRLREIAPNPPRLFAALERVNVEWPREAARLTMAEVAAAMAEARQALAVVNTKAQARSLFEALLVHDEDAVHLSTRLCAAHRREVLAGVTQRLGEGRPCLVAATQLVEAGVDIDFPAVWRAFGPLDAIAQAAGRCNREGRLPSPGRVTVFRPEDDAVPGDEYRRGRDVTQQMLATRGIDLSSPATYREYFERFYNTGNSDAHRIMGKRDALDFPAVADAFRIIRDNTRPVLVPWGGGREWIAKLDRGYEPTPADLRRLQPFMVGLYPGEMNAGRAAGVVHDIGDIAVFRGDYDDRLGLRLTDDVLQD